MDRDSAIKVNLELLPPLCPWCILKNCRDKDGVDDWECLCNCHGGWRVSQVRCPVCSFEFTTVYPEYLKYIECECGYWFEP